jgi:hypothetical protein
MIIEIYFNALVMFSAKAGRYKISDFHMDITRGKVCKLLTRQATKAVLKVLKWKSALLL